MIGAKLGGRGWTVEDLWKECKMQTLLKSWNNLHIYMKSKGGFLVFSFTYIIWTAINREDVENCEKIYKYI